MPFGYARDVDAAVLRDRGREVDPRRRLGGVLGNDRADQARSRARTDDVDSVLVQPRTHEARDVPAIGIHGLPGAPRRTALRSPGIARCSASLSDLAELPLQLVDLVAEAGRLLEPQVARRVLHLVGEALDQPGQLVAWQVEPIGARGTAPAHRGRGPGRGPARRRRRRRARGSSRGCR